jgi:hypothetical protein
MAGLIYSNHKYNELNVRDSVFDQNFLYNYRNLSFEDRSGHFHLPIVSAVTLDNCTFKAYEDDLMTKLMIDEGEYECPDEACEDPSSGKYPSLYLLMYTGGVGHYVTIKDTTFSTHKVFNETYARLRVYNESEEYESDITFSGVVYVEYATELELESKYLIT